jgi:hypothetical protein
MRWAAVRMTRNQKIHLQLNLLARTPAITGPKLGAAAALILVRHAAVHRAERNLYTRKSKIQHRILVPRHS